MTRPCISAVLPTHNGARFLDEAIASIVGQTRADWELIVVDDASRDATPALVSSWVVVAERPPSVRPR